MCKSIESKISPKTLLNRCLCCYSSVVTREKEEAVEAERKKRIKEGGGGWKAHHFSRSDKLVEE